MSNGNRLRTKFEDVTVPRTFHLRIWDAWQSPSVIVTLDQKERRELRETFDVHLEDLDIHIRVFDECVATGSAHDQHLRRDKNVKVVSSLNMVPQGIEVAVIVVAMTHGVKDPKLDENGYPRKYVLETRVFPKDQIAELFNRANAFMILKKAYRIALAAKESGDEQSFKDLDEALDLIEGGLRKERLTVTVAETVEAQERKKSDEGEKKGGRGRDRRRGNDALRETGAEADAAPELDSSDRSSDALARKLTAAVIGIDPDAPEAPIVEMTMPEPVASASPDSSASKPKKDKKRGETRKGLASLAALREDVPAGKDVGSNGQS